MQILAPVFVVRRSFSSSRLLDDSFLCQHDWRRDVLALGFLTLSFCILKEYFQSVVGPIRRAILTYGPDGRSRGVATVEFTKPEHAATAAQKYNGVEVDKRPMKVISVLPVAYAFRY
jgi:hypothetical protein